MATEDKNPGEELFADIKKQVKPALDLLAEFNQKFGAPVRKMLAEETARRAEAMEAPAAAPQIVINIYYGKSSS